MASLQSIAQKYMNMLPMNETGDFMDMPKFVMVNMLTAQWNGIAIWDGKECVVKIQKRVMRDEQSLNRIVAHEICHAWAYWMVASGAKKAPWHRGHGPTGGWHEAAQRINREVGDNAFVTEYSDETYVEQNEKKFWVYAERMTSGDIMWAWFSRVTEQFIRGLQRRVWAAEGRNLPSTVFTTSDSRFLLAGAKIPSVAKLRDMPEDMKKMLEQAMQSPMTTDGTGPNDFREIIRQAKPLKTASRRPSLALSR